MIECLRQCTGCLVYGEALGIQEATDDIREDATIYAQTSMMTQATREMVGASSGSIATVEMGADAQYFFEQADALDSLALAIMQPNQETCRGPNETAETKCTSVDAAENLKLIQDLHETARYVAYDEEPSQM
jgi:hypothetical protein